MAMKCTREIGATVTNKSSGEQGVVMGRAEYAHSEPTYLVRFRAADGRAAQEWWDESALHPGDTATALIG